MHRRMTWVLRRYWCHTLVSRPHIDSHNDSDKGTLSLFKYFSGKGGTNTLCSISKQLLALLSGVFSLNWYSPASQNIWKWELSEETLKWFQCFYLSKLSVKINYMPKMSCWPSWVALKGCCRYKLWCKHQQPCRKRTRSALLQHAASGKYSAGHSLLSFPAKSTCCCQYQCCLCPFPSTERTVWYMDSLNK